MFGLAMLYGCKVDEGFRHIVSDQLRPYFPLDIFRLVMAAHKGDIYRNVKRVRIREVKIPDKAFGMDVLCAEEKYCPFSMTWAMLL